MCSERGCCSNHILLEALVNDRAENFVSTVDEAVDSTSILAYLKDNLKKEKSEVIGKFNISSLRQKLVD